MVVTVVMSLNPSTTRASSQQGVFLRGEISGFEMELIGRVNLLEYCSFSRLRGSNSNHCLAGPKCQRCIDAKYHKVDDLLHMS